MNQEIWAEIPWAKYYAVSNKGQIKRLNHTKWCVINNSNSKFKEKLLSINYTNSKGYGRIAITALNNSRHIYSIHRLVAEMFISNPNNYKQVNHKDGNKKNNSIENLEWCSGHQNMQHRIHCLGIKPWKLGSACNFAILTEQQVKQIPSLLAQGFKKCEIAKQFKVSNNTITEITAKRSWKHLNLF